MDNTEASTSSASSGSQNPQSSGYTASDYLRIRSGVINPEMKNKSTLILTVNTREIDIFNVTVDDLKYLNSITDVAYYSHKNEKTTDVTVRNSKYSKTFDLNLDLNSLRKDMAIDKTIIKPYKLNLYNKGSFFAAHRDTNRPGLMGTLILILPTTYTGGEICFGDFNLEATMPKDKLRFVYFDIGLEHSIKKVESGCRITLVYNVLDPASSTSYIKSKISFNEVPTSIYQNLLREAIKYCEGRKNILFGEHKYRNDVFYKLLKDLKKAGLEVVQVYVEKNDHSYCYTKPEDISKIDTVYEIEELEEGYAEDSGELDLEGLAQKTYSVKHVLFPLASNLKEHSIQAWKTGSGYMGNSPEVVDYEIECYTAYLINPKDDDDDDDDDYNEEPQEKKQKRWYYSAGKLLK